MTAGELVLNVERQWSKQLGADQRANFLRKLTQFNPIQLENIFDKLLEECNYFPRVSNIFDAARDLGFLQQSLERETLGNKQCSSCEGTGWQYITEAVTMPDGVTFEAGDAFRRCECRKREKAIHAA